MADALLPPPPAPVKQAPPEAQQAAHPANEPEVSYLVIRTFLSCLAGIYLPP